jgi:hypothetical protein
MRRIILGAGGDPKLKTLTIDPKRRVVDASFPPCGAIIMRIDLCNADTDAIPQRTDVAGGVSSVPHGQGSRSAPVYDASMAKLDKNRGGESGIGPDSPS